MMSFAHLYDIWPQPRGYADILCAPQANHYKFAVKLNFVCRIHAIELWLQRTLRSRVIDGMSENQQKSAEWRLPSFSIAYSCPLHQPIKDRYVLFEAICS